MTTYDFLPPLLVAAIAFAALFSIYTRFKKSLYNVRMENAKLADLVDKQQKEIEKQNSTISELVQLNNNTLENDRLKTEFFSNTVHELKTPLSVILGALQLLEQKTLEQKTLEQKTVVISPEENVLLKHLATVKRNCYRLLRLIGNILDIVRIDSGYAVINPVNCNIVYLVEEITQSVLPYAQQKNIQLGFDTEHEEIITAVDVDKMERIMLNLLSNAIKYSKPGGKVEVKVWREKGYAVISVKDDGPGIPPDKQEVIFERFRQANISPLNEAKGSGIGLSLVKSFVELHNGNIKLKSMENKGSEFIVEIPIKLSKTFPKNGYCLEGSKNHVFEAINIEFSDIHPSTSYENANLNASLNASLNNEKASLMKGNQHTRPDRI